MNSVVLKSFASLALGLNEFPVENGQEHWLNCLNHDSWGLGLSYADHNNEVGLNESIFFKKIAPITPLEKVIKYRDHLDYEGEISILLHRQEPELFGYFLHNDLTDRGVQVALFDKTNMAPGFSKSKSFLGANAHSLSMFVGTNETWQDLNLTLAVNGVVRQRLEARNNAWTPNKLHAHFFGPTGSSSKDWVLVGTGTVGGTLFRSPSLSEKVLVFAKAWLSPQRAKRQWLKSLHFLKVGDEIRLESKLLGAYNTKIIN